MIVESLSRNNDERAFLSFFLIVVLFRRGFPFDGPDLKGRKGDGDERDQRACCGRDMVS